MNAPLKNRKRSIWRDALSKKLCWHPVFVIGQICVLVPCVLVGTNVLAGNKGVELRDGGSVRLKGMAQDSENIWAVWIALRVPTSGSYDGLRAGESGVQLGAGGATSIKPVNVKQQTTAEECSEDGCDGWGEGWQWMIAGLVPMLMFIGDALLTQQKPNDQAQQRRGTGELEVPEPNHAPPSAAAPGSACPLMPRSPQQRFRSHLAKIVGSKRAVTGDQLPVLVTFSSDVVVQDFHPESRQFLADKPRHLAGHVSDVGVLLVQGVRENADLVALESKRV